MLADPPDEVVKFPFLDLPQRLIELDMVEVQQRVGGDEDRYLGFSKRLIRLDDILLLLVERIVYDNEAVFFQQT